MCSKKRKRLKKVVTLLSFAFVCVALLMIPTALGQGSTGDKEDSDYEPDYPARFTVFTAPITVDGQQADCSFTVINIYHDIVQGGTDHYVEVGYPGKAAIDKKLTGDVLIPEQVQDDKGNTFDVIGVGAYAFRGCSVGTTGLKDNKTVTEVGNCAYLSCKNLVRTDLETSVVKKIRISAFSFSSISDTGLANNEQLKAYQDPRPGKDGIVQPLSDSSFAFCDNLKSTGLENNDQITYLPRRIFQYCKNLEATGLENNSTVATTDLHSFLGCNSLSATGLRNNTALTTLGDETFSRCEGLKDTGLAGSSVKELGSGCFSNCKKLADTELDKNNSVESIGQYAFQQTALVSTGLSNNTSVKTMGGSAFRYIPTLTDTGLAGNSTLESTGGQVFFSCKNIKDTGLSTNTGLKEIARGVFTNCSALTKSGLAENKTIGKIGFDAFANCNKLGSVSFDDENAGDLVLNGRDGQLEIEDYAFSESKYTRIYDYCDEGGLVVSDKAFGNGYQDSQICNPSGIIRSDRPFFNQKAPITTVYVPDLDKWTSSHKIKIAGNTYSGDDNSLVSMSLFSKMSAARYPGISSWSEVKFTSVPLDCSIELSYASNGEKIGTYKVVCNKSSILIIDSRHMLHDYEDTIIASIAPGASGQSGTLAFPADQKAQSYNSVSGELNRATLAALSRS